MSLEHPTAREAASEPTPPEAVRESPLHRCHSARGATFMPFAGWLMPLRYGSELAEHRAVRQAAGVFDLSHMAEIEVRGARAGEALDFALVGHLSALGVGAARYTMICDSSGGILDDLVVYRRDDEEYLVVANAANAATVRTALEERCGGAQVVDATDRYGLVAIQGPRALETLEQLTAAPVGEIAYYSAAPAPVGGVDALVARTGYTGEDGFELFLPAPRAAEIFDALLEAGRDAGAVPAGLAARDSLRLEAGMPLYGNELTSARTPYEAGLGRVVRLDKPGAFVGREALERRAAEGPGIVLVGLTGAGRRAPRHGYRVLDPLTGGEVGTVTSGALSPTLERPIAMAYVEAARATPGHALEVDVRGQAVQVEVTKLPFYKRARDGAGR